ncbi:MAG TPA: response regulator [Bacteroidia bacterium]|jgi:PAS domain S-box-containing protein|nr:response regulator [Bacteroidia bacterium]
MEEKINILLIEDNLPDARLIDIYLKESYNDRFNLKTAGILSEGLELLKKNNFDIIIIDLSLPDSTGVDTFRSVFKAASEKPIIVLTGLEDESIGITTVKLGAQDFLVKGKLNSKGLKQSINYSIERYKLLKELSENAKKLEEKSADLLREKQKLAEAQKLAHIGSWEWTVNGNGFTCSDELYHILGVEPGELKITYQEFFDFIYPDDKKHVISSIQESMKNLLPFDFFHRITRRDGEVRDIHTRGELLLDENKKVLRVVGTEQDITIQKKEAELEQLAMVAIKSFNAVTIANKDGKIEWVNEGFTRLFGYTLEDVKGTYGQILRRGEPTGLSPENDFYKVILRDKKPLAYESKNYSKEGNVYWVLTSLTPLLDDKGNVEKIISIDSDISKQKRAEKELMLANTIAEQSLFSGNRAIRELNKAKKQLEESLKVKEQFLANMSHEIRTPMNAIIGFTHLLSKSEFTGDDKQYLNAIQTSGENLLVIINDILDFSKLESGKVTFENIRFKLPELVLTLIEMMHPKAIEKNINLELEIDEDIPQTLVGDPTRLNQILINLVGNAIKFTNKGEVKITVSVVNETENKIGLKFGVKDTGIGIPEESLNKIFESFTQAANDTSRKYGGTGLGLSITRQLIELQGGTIWVSSTLNKGSLFEFKLNFWKDLRHNNLNHSAPKYNLDQFPLKGVKVLVVEDNTFNQILASKILENWQCVVEIAENGKIAIEKVKKNNFDIILMDIQLPEMDGYETTNFIRNKIAPPKSKVPIIAMTAHAFSNEADKCFKAKMNDYISKPFDENKLFNKILAVLQLNKT